MEGKSFEPTRVGPVARALSSLRSPGRIVVSLCIVVLGIGGLAELVAGPAHVSGDFFLACATVGPLFGLALFVEIALVMAPIIELQGATPANRATIRALVRINVAMLLIAESAALYAAGSGTRSAFLVVCSVLPWLIQVALLAQTTYYRTGISKVGPG